MKIEKAIEVLKMENELKKELNILERVDPIKSAKRIAKLKNDIKDLEFSIKALEKQVPPKLKEKKVPKCCYEEFGNDLDGCSRQSSQGCGGCPCLE